MISFFFLVILLLLLGACCSLFRRFWWRFGGQFHEMCLFVGVVILLHPNDGSQHTGLTSRHQRVRFFFFFFFFLTWMLIDSMKKENKPHSCH